MTDRRMMGADIAMRVREMETALEVAQVERDMLADELRDTREQLRHLQLLMSGTGAMLDTIEVIDP